ncbi:hypothetical protein GOB91_29840 [Sinorhizobium meliloti]|uniref:ATP-binding protein n=1 Tax=Rhizobium meliloti TaxID=382 RepID=UPI000FD2A977|nr:ATP-binding protein [Sinorhizobium meliloti]MDW9701505.1 hypothetical protein [Sinorhizobium meliloti]MDW9714219.1 hypothetical protein [Sinorhizobium meliloti]MDW9726448.1 hypothetical protein [Sinorhizobium meliloti]MDW9732791.1 hypothetical protein [Sinorhizobium meliloti]MDW9738909.1 hypothetical protein [Sinorhizobium meliloti]
MSVEILDRIVTAFEKRIGLNGLAYEDVLKGDKTVRILHVAHATERLYAILNECISEEVTDDQVHVTLKSKSSDAIIKSPEAKLLLKVLSESQNINRHSFSSDFFERYTRSVSGAEVQIVSSANHVVTGRRGAGKSMLLLYCLKSRQRDGAPNVWVDVQTYSGRKDEQAISDIVIELLFQIDFPPSTLDDALAIRHKLEASDQSVDDLRRLVPKLRRILSTVSQEKELFVFLDDLHIFDINLQYVLLDVLYSIFRGNRIFLKISAIETLISTYNAASKMGIEIPQDAQRLGLDYNLTTPDKAAEHIESILDSHAHYAALPSIRRLCSSSDVLPRLTWVSAGVPRDAINLFAQSMLKASASGKKRVTVSNVNMAASENLSIKIKDLQSDASAAAEVLNSVLERIRQFCVLEIKSNAFLVEIKSGDEAFKNVLRLVQLRLLHVISEGITPKEAGTKFMALILDYGLYTGVRAAASVELCNKDTESVSAKDLRKLKILKL